MAEARKRIEHDQAPSKTDRQKGRPPVRRMRMLFSLWRDSAAVATPNRSSGFPTAFAFDRVPGTMIHYQAGNSPCTSDTKPGALILRALRKGRPCPHLNSSM